MPIPSGTYYQDMNLFMFLFLCILTMWFILDCYLYTDILIGYKINPTLFSFVVMIPLNVVINSRRIRHTQEGSSLVALLNTEW